MLGDPAKPLSQSYWVIPERLLAGEYPGSFEPEMARRRIESFLQAGVDTFVDLTKPGELEPYEPVLIEQARQLGIQPAYSRFPIQDRGLPSRQTMLSILDTIDKAISAGRKVYVHCWGGVGRTGTVVGCYLVRHGSTGAQAAAQLAEWWKDVPKHEVHPRTPETGDQLQYILDWKE